MAGILDVGTLLGRLDLDTGPFQDALDSSDGALGAAGEKMGATAKIIGAGIGAALAFALAQAINVEEANSKLQAQLGLTKDQSAALGKTAGELFASNYGDSIESVNDALASVVRNIDGMANASSDTLKTVTAQVLDLSSAFGVDLAESTRAVGVLMKTGMAKDATQALDIITKGLQSPVNAAGDLLDTFDEYSTVFRTLGLDGADALGLLQQGLKGGARDADQIADSLKELLLRVQAGDANGGLRAIGLDAKAMQAALQAGGEGAKTATEQIITGFKNIASPADKAQIGLALFGTKAEDAQKALGSLDLKTAASDFEALNGPIEGAGAAMDSALGSSRQAQIDTFIRGVQGIVVSLGQKLLPVVDVVLTALSGLAEIISGAIQVFTDMPAPIQVAILALVAVRLAVSSVGVALKEAFLSNPIGIAIVGITTVLGYLVGSTDSAAQAAEKHAGKVKDLTATLDENTGAITKNTRAAVTADIGPERLRQLKELGITTGDYTDAILGNVAAQRTAQSEMVNGTSAVVRAGEGYSGLADKLAVAEVSANDLAKAFLNNDYSTVNARLQAVGLTAYDTGDGLLTVANAADGSSAVLADLTGKATELRGAYNDLNGKTADVAQAQLDFKTNAEANAGATSNLGGKAADAAADMKALGLGTQDTVTHMGELNAQTQAAVTPMTYMQTAFKAVSDTASAADDSVKFFNITVNAMMGINVTAQAATKLLNDSIRSTAAAFKDANDATKGHVKSLLDANGAINTTTEAGSKLYDGLQGMVKGYDTATTAAYNAAVGTKGTAGALADAQFAAENARAKFLDMAKGMNLSETQAGLLADSLGIVEGKKLTDKNFAVNAQGIDPATQAVDALDKKKISDKKFSVTMVADAIGASASQIATLFKGGLFGPPRAEGGPIIGPGAKGVDSVLTPTAPGEWVLNDTQVDQLGGFAGVARFLSNLDKTAGFVPVGAAPLSPTATVQGGGNTYQAFVYPRTGDVAPDELLRAMKELERSHA